MRKGLSLQGVCLFAFLWTKGSALRYARVFVNSVIESEAQSISFVHQFVGSTRLSSTY
jgi:hypothetical protein